MQQNATAAPRTSLGSLQRSPDPLGALRNTLEMAKTLQPSDAIVCYREGGERGREERGGEGKGRRAAGEGTGGEGEET